MRRREFIAAGVGGGVVLLGGASALSSGGSSAGPDYGDVPVPPSTGSVTFENGTSAALYAAGRVALSEASLVTQHSGVPAVVGRLRNVSSTSLAAVSIGIRFLDEAGAVLAGGRVTEGDLARGGAWRFVISFPGDEGRLAGARILGIDAE